MNYFFVFETNLVTWPQSLLPSPTKGRCVLISFLFVFALVSSSGAQSKLPPFVPNQDKFSLPKSVWDTLVNRSFASIVTGTSQNTFAKYFSLSLNPTNAQYSFNGYAPLHFNKDGVERLSTTFSAAGGLIDDNVTALWKNGSFNTNYTYTARLNFRLDNASITFFEKDFQDARAKDLALMNNLAIGKQKIKSQTDVMPFTSAALHYKRDDIISEIKATKDSIKKKFKTSE